MSTCMIDNPDQVERLMTHLRNMLPLSARATPRMIASLRDPAASAPPTPHCTVTRIDYAGDEGGIVCHVSFRETDGSNVVVVSITHLEFDRRLQVAREVAAYQKHRIKRLRREQAFGTPLTSIR
jgi:hypothetical protein